MATPITPPPQTTTRIGQAASERVEVGITAGAGRPRQVRLHAVLLELPPGPGVAVEVDEREPMARSSAGPVDWQELEAGGDAAVEGGEIGVDHGVGEAADPRDQRHAAIAEAVELGQATGLETRRNQHRIRPALEEMRQRLAVAGDDADAAGMAGRGGAEHGLDRRFARTEHGEAGAAGDQAVDARAEDIHALLPTETAHHAEQEAVAGHQAEGLGDGALVGDPPRRASSRSRWRRDRDRQSESQTAVSMPLTMPERTSLRYRSRPSRPMPPLGGADLLGIGRADGGDGVGVLKAGLEEADSAIILDAVDAPCLRRQAEAREDRGGKATLEGNVVDRHHALGSPRTGVAEIGRDKARLPVVAMDDVGNEGLDGAGPDIGSGAAERRETLPVVRPVGAVRRRDRGCRAGRTASGASSTRRSSPPAVPERMRASAPKRSS